MQMGLEQQLLSHCNILMCVVLTFSSLLQLRSVPPHCLRGLRFVYSQLESLTCSKCVSTLEVSVSVRLTGSYTGDQIGKYGGSVKHHLKPSHIHLFLPYPFWCPTPQIMMKYSLVNYISALQSPF